MGKVRQKILGVLAICIFLSSGCAALNTTATVESPEGKVWTVNSPSQALVTFKSGDMEISVDTKRDGFWEGALKYLLMKPEISVMK